MNVIQNKAFINEVIDISDSEYNGCYFDNCKITLWENVKITSCKFYDCATIVKGNVVYIGLSVYAGNNFSEKRLRKSLWEKGHITDSDYLTEEL